MLIVKYTIETTATPGQIWRVWEDVENWKSWDHEIEFCRIYGPFRAGTKGEIKMLNSPVLQTQIMKCEPLRMYVFEAKLFLAKHVSTSLIEEINEKTYVTFHNEIRGPLAFLYALLIGRGIKEKTPGEMREMLEIANRLA